MTDRSYRASVGESALRHALSRSRGFVRLETTWSRDSQTRYAAEGEPSVPTGLIDTGARREREGSNDGMDNFTNEMDDRLHAPFGQSMRGISSNALMCMSSPLQAKTSDFFLRLESYRWFTDPPSVFGAPEASLPWRQKALEDGSSQHRAHAAPFRSRPPGTVNGCP